MTYNSLQGIFTTMIGLVTWPPFLYHIFIIYKGDQVTKLIIVVKIPCKLHVVLVLHRRTYLFDLLCTTTPARNLHSTIVIVVTGNSYAYTSSNIKILLSL